MNFFNRHILIIGLFVFFVAGNALAQKKKATRIKVGYEKQFNMPGTLVASLLVREKRYEPFSNATVIFYSINDTSKVLIDELKTDSNGLAKLVIAESSNIYKDDAGIMMFEVEYIGTELTKGSSRKTSIKQADLNVSFIKQDEVKFIEVDLQELSLDDQDAPIENVAVLFYIKGTFSLLNLGKEKTDENGKAKIEFPVDMPGDTLGVLTIVAKVEDHDIYGSIESRGEMDWGIPFIQADEKRRGLGDTDAPLWMVYTLITLLSAVWFHYLYVIYMIIKIRLAK